jgi:hypothetical protein
VPKVLIGVGGPDPHGPCDVVVDDPDEIVQAVERNPQAATVLVQLLRSSESLDVPAALVAESLAYATLQAGPEFARWLENRPVPQERHGGSESPVEVERKGDELLITLNRPEVHNAYNAAMRDALVEAFDIGIADPDISIRLAGRGPSFCSGGDLNEFGTTPDPTTAHLIRTTRSPGLLIAALAFRCKVTVHGACVGAGIELAAFARSVVARGEPFFQLPEVGMGLVPGAGGTVSLPRRIGRQRTAELALTGRRLDLDTALRWGLVDRIP